MNATATHLSICQCDSVGDCVKDLVISKQDEVFLCVWTKKQIANVEALTFHQGGLSFSTIADGSSNDVTWVVKDGSSCMIRTRLDQDFFKPSFRGTKRTSALAQGAVGLEGNTTAHFEIEIPLQTSRLTSYTAGNGVIIAFCILLLIVIGLWALFVTVASLSRNRAESLTPEKALEIEERRLVEIYTIWLQSQWSKTNAEETTNEVVAQPVSVGVSRTWSSSSSEEEKEEIEPYEDETLFSTPSVYAANLA